MAKWNPYNVTYSELKTDPTGSGTKANPYSRSNFRNFFHTPASFFTGESETDAADTTKAGGVWIKNAKGETVNTVASGVRILFPELGETTGAIRQRYPVMPIYGEGNSVWKRLNAFEDSLEGYQTSVSNDDVYYTVDVSHSADFTEHKHNIQISLKKYNEMKADPSIKYSVTTTKAVGHSHDLVVFVDSTKSGYPLVIQECGGDHVNAEGYICFDSHFPTLVKEL